MNSVTCFTKSLNPSRAATAFADVSPDSIRTLHVRPSRYQHLIDPNPLQAGIDLHAVLSLLGNRDPLSPKDKGYFPYLATLRGHLQHLGVESLVPEQPLAPVAPIGYSQCDLLVRGGRGLAPKGVVEIKVVQDDPEPRRGVHFCQTGLYARMAAGLWGDFDNVWAALVYMDLGRHTIDVLRFCTARQLIFRAMDLWQEAA